MLQRKHVRIHLWQRQILVKWKIEAGTTNWKVRRYDSSPSGKCHESLSSNPYSKQINRTKRTFLHVLNHRIICLFSHVSEPLFINHFASIYRHHFQSAIPLYFLLGSGSSNLILTNQQFSIPRLNHTFVDRQEYFRLCNRSVWESG